MVYPFSCSNCGQYEEVIKSISEYSAYETCSKCGGEMSRVFTPFHFTGSKNYWPEYNHAFGKVMHTKRAINYECAKKGFVEVGGETADSYGKTMDKKIDDKLNNWDSV